MPPIEGVSEPAFFFEPKLTIDTELTGLSGGEDPLAGITAAYFSFNPTSSFEPSPMDEAARAIHRFERRGAGATRLFGPIPDLSGENSAKWELGEEIPLILRNPIDLWKNPAEPVPDEAGNGFAPDSDAVAETDSGEPAEASEEVALVNRDDTLPSLFSDNAGKQLVPGIFYIKEVAKVVGALTGL